MFSPAPCASRLIASICPESNWPTISAASFLASILVVANILKTRRLGAPADSFSRTRTLNIFCVLVVGLESTAGGDSAFVLVSCALMLSGLHTDLWEVQMQESGRRVVEEW